MCQENASYMDNLVINPKSNERSIPRINFNAKTAIMELEGESYMEEAVDFYKRINDWLIIFLKNTRKNVTFNIKLSYFNTSSSRCLLDMLYIIKDFEKSGGKFKLNWKYSEADPDFEDEITDFENETGLKINIV